MLVLDGGLVLCRWLHDLLKVVTVIVISQANRNRAVSGEGFQQFLQFPIIFHLACQSGSISIDQRRLWLDSQYLGYHTLEVFPRSETPIFIGPVGRDVSV